MSTVEVLQTIDDGGALEELKDAIEDVTRAVKSRGGTGKVTLELTFTKEGRSQVGVTDKIKVAKPAVKKDKTIFFTTTEGQLSRDDTRQGEFDMDPIGSDGRKD